MYSTMCNSARETIAVKLRICEFCDVCHSKPRVECFFFFFFQAEDGIRDVAVTGVQTCALPIFDRSLAQDARAARGGDRRVSRRGGRPQRLWRCLVESRESEDLPVRGRGAGADA